MIDSDGTTTSCRLESGFIPPADVPEKTGEGDSDSDSDGAGGAAGGQQGRRSYGGSAGDTIDVDARVSDD